MAMQSHRPMQSFSALKVILRKMKYLKGESQGSPFFPLIFLSYVFIINLMNFESINCFWRVIELGFGGRWLLMNYLLCPSSIFLFKMSKYITLSINDLKTNSSTLLSIFLLSLLLDSVKT